MEIDIDRQVCTSYPSLKVSAKDIRDTIKRIGTNIDSKNTEVKKVASESFHELGSSFKRFLEMVIKRKGVPNQNIFKCSEGKKIQ